VSPPCRHEPPFDLEGKSPEAFGLFANIPFDCDNGAVIARSTIPAGLPVLRPRPVSAQSGSHAGVERAKDKAAHMTRRKVVGGLRTGGPYSAETAVVTLQFGCSDIHIARGEIQMRANRRIISLSAVAILAGFGPTEARADVSSGMRGKSIVISWMEFQTARRIKEDGQLGQSRSVSFPNKMIVYVSTEGRLFNRLQVGNGASDQVGQNPEDPTKFAPRQVRFSGHTLTVTNTFGNGRGGRQITATLNGDFSGCEGSVVVGLSGGSAKQIDMNGHHHLVDEAHTSSVQCMVSATNMLQ
jgi:hypothetical protein